MKGEHTSNNCVVKVYATGIWEGAVLVAYPDGRWINFNEQGDVFSYSKGISLKDAESAKSILPDMEPLRRQRREWRQLLREEAARVQTDGRVPKPTERHSSFREGCAFTVRRRLAEELVSLGYQTALEWMPMCVRSGTSPYNWLLWPPYIPRESHYGNEDTGELR